MAKGRHRAPSTLTPSLIKLATLTSATLVLPVFNFGTAQASESGGVLEIIAQCESGNQNVNNRTVRGSTASGFLQILDSTWKAHGGKEFASRAISASREEQFIVGQRILANQGISAWNPSKGCWGKRVTAAPRQSIAPVKKVTAPPKKTVAPEKKKTVTSAPRIVKKSVAPPAKTVAKKVAKTYLIKRGDTLWKISRHNHTTVNALFNANRDTVKNPNRIIAGRTLRLG